MKIGLLSLVERQDISQNWSVLHLLAEFNQQNLFKPLERVINSLEKGVYNIWRSFKKIHRIILIHYDHLTVISASEFSWNYITMNKIKLFILFLVKNGAWNIYGFG